MSHPPSERRVIIIFIGRMIGAAMLVGCAATSALNAPALRASADRMLGYYLRLQKPSGALRGFDDACHYCKLPNALVWSGKIAEADAMLDHCVQRFLRPNGDFTNCPVDTHFARGPQKTLHWEFEDFYACTRAGRCPVRGSQQGGRTRALTESSRRAQT